MEGFDTYDESYTYWYSGYSGSYWYYAGYYTYFETTTAPGKDDVGISV